MMKGVMKWVILAAILFLLIPAVSAFAVQSMTIDPSGSLTPGTPVMVSYKITFSTSSGETFPSGSTLMMSTDLDSAKWTWTLILDGVENPRPQSSGRKLELSGFELAYPSKVDESVRVTLEGNAPSTDKTGNKSIVKIVEIDSHSNVVSTVDKPTLIINQGEVATAIAAKRNDLQTFRSHIDEKAAIGIDTSIAETKYNDAKSKIDTAAAQPTSQYTTALLNLNTAADLITDGEKALEKAWAESEVLNAQTPITNVDGVIAWFKGNKSTADLPALSPILSKRESAILFVSTAQDEIASGNYAQARSKAAEAFAKGNESYTDALALQYKTIHSGGWFPDIGGAVGGILRSGIIIIAAVVVVVVLVAVGIIIYRKRSSWDELG
jgi:hypothetical protein